MVRPAAYFKGDEYVFEPPAVESPRTFSILEVDGLYYSIFFPFQLKNRSPQTLRKFLHPDLNISSDLPMCILSPSLRTFRPIATLFTRVPFFPPMSSKTRIPFSREMTAGACMLAGRETEGRAAAAELIQVNPGFSLDRYTHTLPFKNRAQVDLEIAALRRAGLK